MKFKVGRMMKIKLHDDHEIMLDGQAASVMKVRSAHMAMQPPTAQA